MFFRKSRSVRELTGEKRWELPTSMIDVVFLLLIFFMCASKFRVLERRLDVFLPRGGPEKGDPPIRRKKEPVTIKVSAPGPSMRAPRFRIREWSTRDPNRLAGLLMQLARTGEYRIFIDGEANCPFRHVMSAVDACARARLQDVSFRPPPAARS